MARKIKITDDMYQQLNARFKGDEKLMEEYIIQAVKNQISKDESSDARDEKESLENYLNKGKPGSRNYGVKGQGW